MVNRAFFLSIPFILLGHFSLSLLMQGKYPPVYLLFASFTILYLVLYLVYSKNSLFYIKYRYFSLLMGYVISAFLYLPWSPAHFFWLIGWGILGSGIAVASCENYLCGRIKIEEELTKFPYHTKVLLWFLTLILSSFILFHVLTIGMIKEHHILAKEMHTIERDIFSFSGLSGIIFICVIIYAYLVVSNVKKTVESLRSGFERVSKGDLSFSIAPTSFDELGMLSMEFNHMISSLSSLMEEVKTSGLKLASAVTQLSSTVRVQAESVTQQSAGVSEISAAAEELAQSAREVASLAENMAGKVEDHTIKVENEEKSLRGMVEDMGKIIGKMEEMSKGIENLGGRISKIENVIEMVKEIVEETHILSINAAIEAVAAGEYGKRFSVVADEVRRLAEESKTSLREIERVIQEVMYAMEPLAKAGEEGAGMIEEGRKKVENARESLKNIVQEMKEIMDAFVKISFSTGQQRNATEQVALAVKDVAGSLQRIEQTIKELHTATESLVDVGEKLREKIKEFSLENG